VSSGNGVCLGYKGAREVGTVCEDEVEAEGCGRSRKAGSIPMVSGCVKPGMEMVKSGRLMSATATMDGSLSMVVWFVDMINERSQFRCPVILILSELYITQLGCCFFLRCRVIWCDSGSLASEGGY